MPARAGPAAPTRGSRPGVLLPAAPAPAPASDAPDAACLRPMPFSLAGLRHRAADFARLHAASGDEKSQDQDFVRDLLDVFTSQGRRAQFQVRVKKPDGAQGFIDAL